MKSTPRATRRLVTALLLLGAVGGANAQAPLPAELQGSYQLLPEQSDDVASVVKEATSGRRWPVRALVRDRLTRTLRPTGEVRIEVAGEQIAVTAGSEPPVRTTLNSAPIAWRHPSGERMQVRARVEGGALMLTFQGSGATREQAYRLRDSGETLEVRVTLSGERLGGAPITFTLVYARLGEGEAL